MFATMLNLSICMLLCDPGGPSLGQGEGAAAPSHCQLLWRWNPGGHNGLWRGKEYAESSSACTFAYRIFNVMVKLLCRFIQSSLINTNRWP